MAFQFHLPDIGEGVVEGEIVSWKVKEGDKVKLDQPLVEVMTDKATVELPSPRAGTVRKVLVTIDEDGAAPSKTTNGGPKSHGEPSHAPPARHHGGTQAPTIQA